MSPRVTEPILDPFELARRQLARDVEATEGRSGLLQLKVARMSSDAHAFLRGSDELFYAVLAADPSLAPGPPTRGYVVGDMHAENLGIYRAASGAAFDVDDFDDAGIAPLRFDVVRAGTSLMVAALELGVSAAQALATTSAMLDVYVASLRPDARPLRRLPEPIAGHLRAAGHRTPADDLKGRVERRRGRLAFERGARYSDLAPELEHAAPSLMHAYFDALGEAAPRRASEVVLEDAAWRIAGTGSLGVARIGFVLRRGSWVRMIELKECRASVLEQVGAPNPWAHPADRVIAGANALPAEPARGLAAVWDPVRGISWAARRLTPQRNRVAVRELSSRQLLAYARVVGERLAAAHRRGSVAALELGLGDGAPDPEAWAAPDVRAQILDAAVRLAGLHRAIYLAYVRLAPR